MPKDKGRRSPLQGLKKRYDAAESDEQRIALLETAKPAELQALVVAMSLETQIRFIAQASAERLALFKAKGVKFGKLVNAQPEEVKATIEAILAPMPLRDQCEFMRTGKNPEWAAFLKAKRINVTPPDDAVVIRGGNTKHGTGRRWGKRQFIQEAFIDANVLGHPLPPKQPNLEELTKRVNDALKQRPDYQLGGVTRWAVKDALEQARAASAGKPTTKRKK
jgi:hypothetical protein